MVLFSNIMIVTIYKSLKEVTNGFQRDVNYVFERIRSGKSQKLIEQIQAETDEEKQQLLKKELPAINFQGVFKERNDKGIKQFSGLMPLDFDKFKDKAEMIALMDSLRDNEYVFAMFISPRGNGFKLIIKIPLDGASNYKGYFDSLKNYFDSDYFDVSSSNISRLCYESYDPNIYINPNALIYNEVEEPEYSDIGTITPIFAINSDNRIISNLLTWWKKKYGNTKGSRNTNLFKLAMALNCFGIDKHEALNVLNEFQESDFTLSEIETLCKSAYKKSEVHGTRFFEDNAIKFKIEKQVRQGKSAKEIIKLLPDVDPKKIDEASETIRENIDIEDYWSFDDKGKFKLSPHKYKFWLENNNFSKFFPTESKTFTFIQIDQNQVEETNEKRIKDYVLNNLMERKDIGYSPYDSMASSTKAFNIDFLGLLASANIKIKEDTQDEIFLYYKNCVVKITKDSFETIDYLDVDGYVWKNQIIDRDFAIKDHHNSEYRSFIWYIAGENKQKYNTFKSVIGYLMHSFKTSANNKAVILNDSVISENPNGGSGKGLFCNALSHLKKVSSIDGKTFDFNKSFPYQTVSTDCQLLVFDDVKKNFDFERLFSLITEGITIEYKGQDAIKLPVQKSPKIIITTNYTVGGVGGSFERRKFEVELSDYFNAGNTPLMKFGKLLFDEWDDDEWSRFDNYMIQCAQYYLNNGLVAAEFGNIHTRKFIKNTSFEFYEWTKTHEVFSFNDRLSKRDKYNEFLEEYQDFKKWLSQKKFKQWLENYCTFYDYKYAEGNSTPIGRWFTIENESQMWEDLRNEEKPNFQ
jgi:hypothetical protein